MTGGILGFLGGVGLFLFGMATMTAALRDLAGEGLRGWLLRMTRTTWRGVLSGAAIAAAVQSSTAVTVMTIGFVGAGFIGLAQSLGVIFGANIGTTVTGWIIAFPGVKLDLGAIAMPVLLFATLLARIGPPRAARFGRALAGLALMFIGLGVMRAAAGGLEGLITPERLPSDTWHGRLALVAIGFGLAAALQGSATGLALALVLMGTGAIDFLQAASLVIGLNVGSTLTGILAAAGGGVAMRRTALANLLFNAVTAVAAFPLLDVVAPVLHAVAPGRDGQTALVLFHTGFNLAGAALFAPLTGPFARLLERLVPDRAVTLAAALDPGLREDSGTALDAAAQTVRAIARATGEALLAALAPRAERDLRPLAALPARTGPALQALEAWLAALHVPPDRGEALERLAALMHLTDHLARLAVRSREMDRIAHLADNPQMCRRARVVAAALARPTGPGQALRLAELAQAHARRHRHSAFLREADGAVDLPGVFRETDALRWLDRVAEHAERIAHYLQAAAGPQGPSEAGVERRKDGVAHGAG